MLCAFFCCLCGLAILWFYRFAFVDIAWLFKTVLKINMRNNGSFSYFKYKNGAHITTHMPDLEWLTFSMEARLVRYMYFVHVMKSNNLQRNKSHYGYRHYHHTPILIRIGIFALEQQHSRMIFTR